MKINQRIMNQEFVWLDVEIKKKLAGLGYEI